MQGDREVNKENPNGSKSLFDSFGGLGFPGSIFGGRDPFDDPFFTRPFGSLFRSKTFSSNSSSNSQQASKSKGPVIKEINSDDVEALEEKEEDDTSDAAWANRNPLVEHPEDQDNDHGKSKQISQITNHNKVEKTEPQTRSVSFQRVTYGGIDGAYYTATTTRRTGNDGVTLEESKQADRTTGQAAHRISRGIHDKGHSVTRKLDSDGKVDTMQTLHNINEDELAGFEQAWRGNADRHFHGLNTNFNLPEFSDAGGGGFGRLTAWGGFSDPFRDHFGRNAGWGEDRNFQAQSSSGRPKKVVRINIE